MSRDKIGRNDPCPCGSGAKSKRCCDGGPPPITPAEAHRLQDAELEEFRRLIRAQRRHPAVSLTVAAVIAATMSESVR